MNKFLRIQVACTMMTSIIVFLACGKTQNSTTRASISYHLERPATNDGENAIIIDYPDDANYYVRISGDKIKASIPLGVLKKAPKRIGISSEAVGTYSLDIIFALGDQTEFIKDKLEWEYDHELPPDPIVSPQTPASRDENAMLLVSASKGPSVTQLWVGGDVAEAQWLNIPKSGKVPIILSDGDGKKKLAIKLRNIAGSESSIQDLIIPRKSLPPENCKAVPISQTISGNTLSIQVSATNDGPLAYRVLGDVEKIPKFKTFEGKTEGEITLSPGPGDKNLLVYIRDEAENFCPEIPLTVRVDPSYRAQKVVLNQLWTDDPVVSAHLSVETFADHRVEMFINGGVAPGPLTFQWVPYLADPTVELTPVDGNRFVTVQIRDNGKLLEAESASIFLKPYLKLGGTGSRRELALSRMIGTEDITITGCAETYINVPYGDGLPCTLGVTPIEATYHLIDGTDVTRAVTP